MDNDIRECLRDIHKSINTIEDYLGAEHNFDSYMAHKMLRGAIEREIITIGEAVNRIDKQKLGIPISNKRQIIGMRNRLIHGYDKINNEVVWSVVTEHLPVLKGEVNSLLHELES
jgi:uncharacterized protein with HEPN domain